MRIKKHFVKDLESKRYMFELQKRC